MQAAIALAARGFGDTVVPRAALRRLGLRRPLHAVPFADPLYDTFAFIARRDAPVSPATSAFVAIVERRLQEVGEGVIYAAPVPLDPVP
jgi:DNA-binding transcriptional LysR family regulator